MQTKAHQQENCLVLADKWVKGCVGFKGDQAIFKGKETSRRFTY